MKYNYNKPHTSEFTGKLLNNKKIIAEEWILKDSFSTKLFSYYDRPSKWIADYKTVKSVIVIGTELQIYNLFCEMLDKYGWQLRDSFNINLKPQYLDLYNNKPLIINSL